MRRLWVQQTVAFSVVVIFTMGAVVFWINQGADKEFRKYITSSEMRWSDEGSYELVEHYQRQGSWEGVESLLGEGVYYSYERRSMVLIATFPDPERLAQATKEEQQPDVILADASGRIVFDSTGKGYGEPLSRNEQGNAWPIRATDDRNTIGFLLLYYPTVKQWGGLEQQFLDRVENLLLLNTAVAVSLIVIMGAFLNRRLNAPLQRLADAARAVAAGDLEQQVQAGGSTEVAQVGQAFNEMTAALKEAETLRQNMVADVAHELRTPISVLQGSLWAILNDAYPLEKAEISRLYDETRLLSRLVEDLRELALADAGQLHLNLCPTNVSEVIGRTVDNFALAAEVQEVSLSAQLPDVPEPVQADGDRVTQVLCNLLVNALRHTPPGGSVVVSVRCVAQAMEIAIADTGEGIAPQDLPRVFERFWRADRARSRGGAEERLAGGTGLGLSVAQSLVQAHGGRIWVESTPGEGTVFRFTLPLLQYMR